MVPRTAPAQDADTLSISGTFSMDELQGTVGLDLAEVYANGNEHGWTLTLHGVSYSYGQHYEEWDDWGGWYGYYEEYVTRVHATSFEFQFFGPDADILNPVVSPQLVSGSLTDGAFLELRNGDYFDSLYPDSNGPFSSFNIGLRSLDPAAGVSFHVETYWDTSFLFATDEVGYPLVEPQAVAAFHSTITDLRPGNSGGLVSYDDLVDIGPPVPPPSPLTLSIADDSVWEGNKGTTRVDLTVTLSRSISDVVTVRYATASGTAVATSDYTSTSGTLTFQPGQTSRMISIAIKGDRKREPNETFSVQLSNSVGATIADAVATATILNDD
jgi:hypothetical protein